MSATKTFVIGGTGVVGECIVERLLRRGDRPYVLSRSSHQNPKVEWICGDIAGLATTTLPSIETLFCTADAALLADTLPRIFNSTLKRVVVFSSTSVITKIDSEILAERQMLQRLADAERRIVHTCSERGIKWTILRPTLIYREGRDSNITPLSKLIRRFGVMPLVGGGTGLRQPVHAEDLADGAIAAAESPTAANRFYSLPGGETLSYREMIGRIFDGLQLPRRMISVSPKLWRLTFALASPLFPNANVAMGIRMTKDMTFDAAPAIHDFGWNPRAFYPRF